MVLSNQKGLVPQKWSSFCDTHSFTNPYWPTLDFCIQTQNWPNHWAAAAAKLLQSCPTLCDPIDGSRPGSPVLEFFQARALEGAAVAFSKSLSNGPQMQIARPQPRATISETLGEGPSNPNFNKLSKALSMVESETHWCISSSKKDSTLNHFFQFWDKMKIMTMQ